MNKEEFLKKLKEDLHALSDEERLKGLEYYEEYFGGNKEEAVAEIKIALESENIKFADIPELKYGGWIYYSEAAGLYKERVNGSGRTKLNDKICSDIIAADEWIYYICANGLYKTRTDGTLTLPVIHKSENKNPEILRIINVTGKFIFYLTGSENYSQNNSLYRVRTDGKRDKFVENNIDFIISLNKWIVYCKNDGGLYKINVNNSRKKIKLCDDKTDNIYFKRSWIYYNNLSDDGKLYRMRTDGKKRQIVE